jgi:hypothetical protein
MDTHARTAGPGTDAPATAGQATGTRPGDRPARLQRRQSTYRGEAGTLVSGHDTHGRRVRVFVPDDDPHGHTGASVVANVRAGRPAFGTGPLSGEPMDLGAEPKSSEPMDLGDNPDPGSTTTPPREAHSAHTESTLGTLGTVPDTTKPEPPVLIPQHGSTGGRKPYNVRLRKALVAEVMDRPEYEGQSLAQVIELALERLLP